MSPWSFSIDIHDERRAIVSVKRMEIYPGKINFLFGESGIGKTLLSKALFGLADAADLNIRINGLPYEQ